MKRSEINSCIRYMERLAGGAWVCAAAFCSWTREDWEQKSHEYDEIRDNMLGWDITDFGMGDWEKVGFALITLRNGNQNEDGTRRFTRRSAICSRKASGRLCIFTGKRARISLTGAEEI